MAAAVYCIDFLRVASLNIYDEGKEETTNAASPECRPQSKLNSAFNSIDRIRRRYNNTWRPSRGLAPRHLNARHKTFVGVEKISRRFRIEIDDAQRESKRRRRLAVRVHRDNRRLVCCIGRRRRRFMSSHADHQAAVFECGGEQIALERRSRIVARIKYIGGIACYQILRIK